MTTDPTPTTKSMNLKELAAFVWRGALFAILVAGVAGVTTYLTTRTQPEVFQASAALLASQPGSNYGSVDVVAPPAVDPSVYQSALLEGPVVPDALARVEGRRLSEKEVQSFLETMKVTVEKKDISSVIRIEVENTDPAYAARVVNAISEALIDWDRNRARQTFARSIAAIEQSIQDIDTELNRGGTNDSQQALQALREQRVKELDAARAKSESSVIVGLLEPLSVASPPTEPVGPRVVFRTFVATVLGLLGAYGLLFIRWSLDNRVRSREDLLALTGLPVLAEFPTRSRRAHRLSGEVANFLRTNLLVATRYQSPLVVAVTSAQSPREKAGVAVSLAESFARAGYATLLVDADLRRPGTTEGLDVSNTESPPLEVYLENPGQRYAPATVGIDGKRTFDFIPSYTSAMYPVELLTNGFRAQLEHWREAYDFIIIDSPPVLPFADTLSIAPHCTGLVLCTSLAETTRERVRDGLTMLRGSEVEVVGTVVTNAPRSRRGTQQYDYSVLDRQSVDPYRTYAQDPRQDRRGARNVRVQQKR